MKDCTDHGWRIELHCMSAAMPAFGAKLTPFAEDEVGRARKSAPPWKQPGASDRAMPRAESRRLTKRLEEGIGGDLRGKSLTSLRILLDGHERYECFWRASA
jgi:hypothetical protein